MNSTNIFLMICILLLLLSINTSYESFENTQISYLKADVSGLKCSM